MSKPGFVELPGGYMLDPSLVVGVTAKAPLACDIQLEDGRVIRVKGIEPARVVVLIRQARSE